MLEDTNSLDGAHMFSSCWKYNIFISCNAVGNLKILGVIGRRAVQKYEWYFFPNFFSITD